MKKESPYNNDRAMTEGLEVPDALRQEERAAPRDRARRIWQDLSEARRSTSRDEIASLTKRFLRW